MTTIRKNYWISKWSKELVLGQIPVVFNEDPMDIANKAVRKGQKYVQRCKKVAWKRWGNEYFTSLHERYNFSKTRESQRLK